MARLAEKSSKAEGSRGGGSIPDFPKFSPQFANNPGAQETNAAIQRWNDLMKRRWVLLDEDLTRRFKLEAGFDDSIVALTARIETEESVRAAADSALALSITTLEATVTVGFTTLTASVVTLQSAMATANGYLESRWTVQVTAGPIVTGMTLYSASGPDTDVSYIAFQADRFQINTASGGNKQLFSATSTAVKLGDVLTVDLAGQKIYIGGGTFANSGTAFYVDASSNFSLGDKLSWNGSTLSITGAITATTGTIGGWTIGATTISANNAVLSSAGHLVLGTSNDVVYLSATDATYRMWIGNVTAGSASFSVTKAGALFSNSGTVGGFTLASDNLSAGSGATRVQLDTNGDIGLLIGTTSPGPYIQICRLSTYHRLQIANSSGTIVASVSDSAAGGSLYVSDGVLVGNGNSGTPSMRFATDLDTGFYLQGTNAIGIAIGAQAAGFFSAYRYTWTNSTVTGIVGVDTSNSKFEIGTTTNHGVRFYTNNSLRGEITNGGLFDWDGAMDLAGTLSISGTQVVTSRQSGVSDGPTDASGGMGTGDDFSGGDTVDKASLTSVVNTHGAKLNSFATKINAIGTAVNTVIDRLQTHGLIS